jgi:hypothetical protein
MDVDRPGMEVMGETAAAEKKKKKKEKKAKQKMGETAAEKKEKKVQKDARKKRKFDACCAAVARDGRICCHLVGKGSGRRLTCHVPIDSKGDVACRRHIDMEAEARRLDLFRKKERRTNEKEAHTEASQHILHNESKKPPHGADVFENSHIPWKTQNFGTTVTKDTTDTFRLFCRWVFDARYRGKGIKTKTDEEANAFASLMKNHGDPRLATVMAQHSGVTRIVHLKFDERQVVESPYIEVFKMPSDVQHALCAIAASVRAEHSLSTAPAYFVLMGVPPRSSGQVIHIDSWMRHNGVLIPSCPGTPYTMFLDYPFVQSPRNKDQIDAWLASLPTEWEKVVTIGVSKCGEYLVFNPLIPHCGPPNDTDEWRCVGFMEWRVGGDPDFLYRELHLEFNARNAEQVFLEHVASVINQRCEDVNHGHISRSGLLRVPLRRSARNAPRDAAAFDASRNASSKAPAYPSRKYIHK